MLRERECEPRDYGRADGVGRASEGRVGVEGRRDGRREAGQGGGGEGEWWLWLGVMVDSTYSTRAVPEDRDCRPYGAGQLST